MKAEAEKTLVTMGMTMVTNGARVNRAAAARLHFPPRRGHIGQMDDLYDPRVLELAADIAHLGRLPDAHGSATKVSRVCGSVMTVDIRLEGDQIAAIGVEPEACALGQASAAVLSQNAVGATVAEIRAARDALAAMLKDGAPPPTGRFWELRHLEGVRHYPPRHTSTLLAFEAAVAAAEEAFVRGAALNG